MYSGNIILIGGPGAGKGTLGKYFTSNGWNVISTGDIFRAEKESGSELGNKIKDLIGKGNLVSDEITNQVIKQTLDKTAEPFVLDGYPRTVPQAKFLDTIAKIGLVFYLEASDETLIKRLTERGKTSGRADDQSQEIMTRRIEQFKKETMPLIDYYKNKNIVSFIDSEQSKEDVIKQAENIISLWK